MPETVEIHGKTFEKTIDQPALQKEVDRVAEEINTDFKGQTPTFIVVLNGAFMFASDLLKQFKGQCNIEFVKYASYSGTESTGKASELIGLKQPLKGKPVVIIEDIIDTGVTIQSLAELMKTEEVAEFKIAAMFMKPDKYKGKLKIDYVGLDIPDDFVIGYGLDFDEMGRNLPHLYTLSNK